MLIFMQKGIRYSGLIVKILPMVLHYCMYHLSNPSFELHFVTFLLALALQVSLVFLSLPEEEPLAMLSFFHAFEGAMNYQDGNSHLFISQNLIIHCFEVKNATYAINKVSQ